jgi:hypothetical protein
MRSHSSAKTETTRLNPYSPITLEDSHLKVKPRYLTDFLGLTQLPAHAAETQKKQGKPVKWHELGL